MNPAFAGTLKSVCIPFGSRIISPLPREHTLVKGSSFGDRFVEGIYLFADSTSPAIHIWDMHRKQEMLVKDYTSYPTEFPFKDPSCLVRPGYTAAEILQMHQEDIAEEERIVAELEAPAVTRSQSAQIAATSLTVHPAPIIVVPSPLASLPARLPVSVAQPLSAPVTTRVPYLDSLLDTPMTLINELDLGKALLKAGFPITLPASYANFPQIQKLPTASGPMVAIGYKTERLTTVKSALWVRFTSPPEFVGRNIQMYPKSFEPTKGPARGADFSILKAINISHPHAVTLRDLGIHEFSSSKLTTLLLRHFSELSKPRESVPSAYDDHGLSDDNADETDSHSMFHPPQQSVEDNESIPLCTTHSSGKFEVVLDDPFLTKKEKKNRLNGTKAALIRSAINRIQAQQAESLTDAAHDDVDTFRLSPKTLNTMYVHRHSSPAILASMKTVLLAPVATSAPKNCLCFHLMTLSLNPDLRDILGLRLIQNTAVQLCDTL